MPYICSNDIEQNPILKHQSRAITLYIVNGQNIPICNPIMLFLNSLSISKSLKIYDLKCKTTESKVHNSISFCRKLPIYNPKPLLTHMNSYTKFEENCSINAQDREQKQSPDRQVDRQVYKWTPKHKFLAQGIT